VRRRLLLFLTAILTALAGCNNRGFSSGDRVLVAKFLYDSNLAEPNRFEVVVFKYPERPLKNNVPTNYIKRLLGLPGEILAIFFGQLYRVPAPEPGEPPYFVDAGKDIDPNDLWNSQFMHDSVEELNERFNKGHFGKFEIIRKPPEVQMALRRIVYDNDYPASDLTKPGWQRWHPGQGSGWTADKDNGFVHQGAGKDAVDWLRYQHILRPMDNGEILPKSRKPELITDFMGYNSFYSQPLDREGVRWDRGDPNPKTPKPNWAGDLMLECRLKVTKAEGEYWMELSRGINRFQARWDLTSGMCTLVKLGMDGKKVELDSKPTRIKAPGSYLVRFANFDARLTVWVDRDLPFDNGRDYPPPEIRGPDDKDLDDIALHARRGPTKNNDLEPASVGSKGAAVEIHNISLWRDTYYTQNAMKADDVLLESGDWGDPDKWDVFKKMPTKTLYVQPGHYLCLGDNSQQSSDSRQWGVVPHRLMLGRALLVYFPFQRAGAIR
jgi:signal peptidase I